MVHLADMKIDSLFYDEDEMMIKYPPNRFDTTFPFSSLPFDIRDIIYKFYFEDYATTKDTLQINAHGEISSPPITNVSKELRDDTLVYLQPYLKQLSKSAPKIEAQVKDYNFATLFSRFTRLTNGDDALRQAMCERTTIHLIGDFSMLNYTLWITGNEKDFQDSSLFHERKTPSPIWLSQPPCLFNGWLSLHRILTLYRIIPCERWKRRALKFLNQATRIQERHERKRVRSLFRGKRIDLGQWGEGLDMRASKEMIKEVVLEVIARWHHHVRVLLRERGRRNRMVEGDYWEVLQDVELAAWPLVSELMV